MSRSARRRDDQGVVAAEFHDGAAEPAVDCLSPHRGPSGSSRSRKPAECAGPPRAFARWSDRRRSTREKMAGSAPVSRQTRSAILITAIAVSGVFSDGFQIVASPQTAASAAFHDQTATGKLKARDDRDEAERMPLLHQAMVGALGLDGQAVKHPRLADGEIADVDHLLHFAFAFGNDFAGSRA